MSNDCDCLFVNGLRIDFNYPKKKVQIFQRGPLLSKPNRSGIVQIGINKQWFPCFYSSTIANPQSQKSHHFLVSLI